MHPRQCGSYDRAAAGSKFLSAWQCLVKPLSRMSASLTGSSCECLGRGFRVMFSDLEGQVIPGLLFFMAVRAPLLRGKYEQWRLLFSAMFDRYVSSGQSQRLQ